MGREVDQALGTDKTTELAAQVRPAVPGPRRERSAGGRGRASRVGGLDGIRALAVLAVIAFHAGLPASPGGFLGVDVFFVLSGYLITDLLVAQRDRTGRLDLRGFWTRRARRLLPALAVLLIVVTAAVAVIEPAQMSSLRPALLAAVTYSSNWYQAFHHISYFASWGPPPPLQHLWSLAIEEQFYLVWPLVLTLALIGLRSRRARAVIAWLGALASAVAMAVIYVPGTDPSRVYYGTDTHAAALMIGAALALTWPLASLASASGAIVGRFDIAGLIGLAVLAWAVGHFSGSDPVLYPYGLVLAAVAAAALTAAAVVPGSVSTLLSLPPLRWLGVRSYGIYLWHWPVIAIVAATSLRSATPWLWIAEPAVAIGLAAISWKWLEEPILRNGFRATCASACRAVGESARAFWRSPARALPVLCAAAALTVACTAGYGVVHASRSATAGLAQQIARGERASAASRHGPGSLAARPTPSPSATTATVPVKKISGSQVTAIGDSVMLASAPELRRVLPGIYIDALVSRQMSAGLQVVQSLADSGRLRHVVVVGLGTNGTVTTGEISELLHLIGPHRELVLVNTYEARPWEHEVNTTLTATARRYPNVVLANWLRAIRDRTGLLWPDQVHPRPPGAKLYAEVVYRAIEASTLTTPASVRAATSFQADHRSTAQG